MADVFFRPLAGARIEVLDGPQAGLSTLTRSDGRFNLSGEFNDTTRFRATKDGHIDSTRSFPARCALCNPNWWLHFNLSTPAPHLDLAGDYAVTFVADAACRQLPDDARTVRFNATATLQTSPGTPPNSWFTMRVDGRTPLADNSFWIGTEGDQFVAWMGDLHGLAMPVFELAPKTYLTFADGEATATVTDPSEISAVFSAAVARCEVPTDWGGRRNCASGVVTKVDECVANRHQIILRRR